MLVILDGQGQEERRAFQGPRAVIRADSLAEVGPALEALEAARAEGRWLAGVFFYELGYALEKRLQPLLTNGPLLLFGVYDGPGMPPPDRGRAYAGPLKPEWDAAAYGRRFRAVKEAIAAGDIYQANLSFRAAFAFAGAPRALYEQLRTASQAPHCAYLDFFDEKAGGNRRILSLSPELFFEIADGRIESRPMKGTSARIGDDETARARLAASPKDRAENLMIVDLIRNDLGRVAETGSVTVSDLFRVETYPALHTMVSTVSARLKPNASIGALVGALFPCGSITGAPKIRAMEILRSLESSQRGAYCGAIGFIAPSAHRIASAVTGLGSLGREPQPTAGASRVRPAKGPLDLSLSGLTEAGSGHVEARFNVAIRTLTLQDGHGVVGIGGGVVQDSREDSEYAECLLKARFFEAGRRPLELIETLKFEAGGFGSGFVRLDRHLARMAASALRLVFRFDADTACQALDAAVEGQTAPLRVRLTLDEAGAHRATVAPLHPNPPHWRYAISSVRTDSSDELLRHKISWRELYDGEVARLKTDEVIFRNERGEITEGARSNIFIKRDGMLFTPALSSGLLPGILRAELLASGAAKEAVLTEADLLGDVYFGNSLRGLISGIKSSS